MFHMVFEFERGEEDCLAVVNAALGGLRLSEVRIEDDDDYMATAVRYRDDRPVSREYRYGYDRLTLACRQREGEERHVWQLDAVAFPRGRAIDSDEFHDRWCAAHPDRTMRMLRQIAFDNADAFVVLYHERRARPEGSRRLPAPALPRARRQARR